MWVPQGARWIQRRQTIIMSRCNSDLRAFFNLQSRGRLGLPKVLISYTFCPQGAQGPVRTLIEGIEREGCVSCARVKAEGGRPLCVGASYRGNACMCLTHSVMRTLAVRICNAVATHDYSRPQCNLNPYNFNMTTYKAGGGSVCHVVAIGRVVRRRLSTPRCEPAEEEPL
jgi:hypothetical protein